MAPVHRVETEISHIRDLVPDPANRRAHNPRNIGMVVDALQHVGAARSIVIDEDNVILAGNGVTEAAAEAGITRVRVVEASGDEIIAVRRSGLTAEQKRALAIYDNRTGELATWDFEQLAADEASGLSLQPFWTEDEAAALLAKHRGLAGGLTDPDEVPAERATDIVLGDLFTLGRHRLICGDSTDALVVDKVLAGVKPHLMVTDPPYGVDYDPTWRDTAGGQFGDGKTVMRGKVANDTRSDWREAWVLFPGDVAYVWCASLHNDAVIASLEASGLLRRSQIVWVKPHFQLSRGDYHWMHEPCWYAVRKGKTGHWTGDRTQTTIWAIAGMNPAGRNRDEGNEKSSHGTQKPVECMRRPIENNSSPGQVVYDPFVGSGTTLIAAEQTGRACYAIELNPTCVQMALDRWEAFTGQKAERVTEAVTA